MVTLLCVAVVGAGVVAATIGSASLTRVYSVEQVRAGLRHDPAAWVGRSVLVRGIDVETFLDPNGLHWGALVAENRMMAPLLPFHAPGSTPLLVVTTTASVTHDWALSLLHAPLVGPLLSRLLLGTPLQARDGTAEGIYLVTLAHLRRCPVPPAANPCAEGILSKVTSS